MALNKKNILKRYAEGKGESSVSIAASLNTTPSNVLKILRAAGAEIRPVGRPRKLSEENEALLISLYKDYGIRAPALAKHFKVSNGCITSALDRNNVPKNKKGRPKKDAAQHSIEGAIADIKKKIAANQPDDAEVESPSDE
jgi:transposase